MCLSAKESVEFGFYGVHASLIVVFEVARVRAVLQNELVEPGYRKGDQRAPRVAQQTWMVALVLEAVPVAPSYRSREPRARGGPRERVPLAGHLALKARLESADDLSEGDGEIDHHQGAVRHLGAAQIGAPEVPLRVVGDLWEACVEEDARIEAAQGDVCRASVVVPGVVIAVRAGGRCDHHDHLPAAGRVVESVASVVFQEVTDAADTPAHDRDLHTADLRGDRDHDAKDPVAKAMCAANVEE
jgi:hypothetical protein